MSDVERLLAEYKEAHRAQPDADPRAFLDRLSGIERGQLSGLIDAYLARAPRRELDAVAFRSSPAATVAEGVQRSLAGAGGIWPAVLPRLRAQARMRRSALVAELAARLGAQSQQDKVASYYHEMEQGRLPAAGVSDTVLEALGKILGWSREALRRAGETPAPGESGMPGWPGGPGSGVGAGAPGAVFARTARPDTDAAGKGPAAPPGGARGGSRPEDWDEVDRLFKGGA